MGHQMMKDQTKNYSRPLNVAEQLAEFNERRKAEFGRGPLPNERLPLPFTMVGGDIPDGPERK